MNVITKSGTNDFHGSAFVFARNQSAERAHLLRGADRTPTSRDFSQQQFGATLGGPISKDKAHFFVSYERNRRNETATIFTNGVLPDEEGPIEKPFRNHLLTAKLNFAAERERTRCASATRSRTRAATTTSPAATPSPRSAATNTNKIHSAVAKNTTVIGTSKVNELTVLFQHFENNILAEYPNVPAINTPDFTAGANVNTPQQTIQKRWQIRDDFSFRKQGWGGDHNFKVGGELLQVPLRRLLHPDALRLLQLREPDPGRAQRRRLRQRDRRHLHRLGRHQRGGRQLDLRGRLRPGRLEADAAPDAEPRACARRSRPAPTPTSSTASARPRSRPPATTASSRTTRTTSARASASPTTSRATRKLVVRGGYGRYYDEIFQNITLYEAWSDPATPLNFVSASPPPWTPNFFAANRDAIRNGFLDPTFAGQPVRLTDPDLVQPYSHHAQRRLLGGPEPQRWPSTSTTSGRAAATRSHRWRINTPQNVNTDISPAGVFAPAVRAVHRRGQPRPLELQRRLRRGQGAHDRSSTAWSPTPGRRPRTSRNDFSSQPADITNADYELDYGPTPQRRPPPRHGGARLPAAVGPSSSRAAFQYNTGKPYNALAGLGGPRATRSVRSTRRRARCSSATRSRARTS